MSLSDKDTDAEPSAPPAGGLFGAAPPEATDSQRSPGHDANRALVGETGWSDEPTRPLPLSESFPAGALLNAISALKRAGVRDASALVGQETLPLALPPREHGDPVEETPWFTLIRHLGQGGMGDVLLARDGIGRRVAMKVIRPELVSDPEIVENLHREAATMTQIASPRIAQVHVFYRPQHLPRHTVVVDKGLDPDWIERVHRSAVLVMEYVVGRTLRERLRLGALPLPKALNVGGRLARALVDLHRNERPVVHRDVKPENVMLCDGRHRLKLLDMGLAQMGQRRRPPSATGVQGQHDAESDPGSFPGLTPRYAAPEQFLFDPVGPPADIWAFGCVLFECLTGQPPFRAAGLVALRAEVLRADPPLGELPTGTPPRVRTLIARCLAARPAQRPDSEEVWNVLRAWASGRTRSHHNLPRVARQDPIGREALVPLVARELRSHRSGVVCLHGLPGVGKRRVAHAAAHRLARLTTPQRPWVVCRTSLDALPRGDGASSIAGRVLTMLRSIAVIGDRVPQEVAPQEAIAVLGGILGRRPTLLVLESIQQVQRGFVELVEALRELAPETTILATALEPPPIFDIALVPVPPLSVPRKGDDLQAIARSGAVRLLLDLIHSTRGGAAVVLTASNAQTIAGICRALGGLPLGIQLIAAHVETLTLEEIERRLFDLLRQSPELPVAEGHSEGVDPTLSLDAAISLAIQDLGVAERSLLARLSVFPQGFSLDAAESICTDPPAPEATVQAEPGSVLPRVHGVPLVQALRGLVRRQLVLRRAARYLHVEPIRQRAFSLLAGSGELASMRTHFVRWFGALIDRGQPERLPDMCRNSALWFAAIDADSDNVRETLRLVADAADGAPCLASFIRALEHYWWAWGPAPDAWSWCERALARIDELEEPIQRVRLLAASAGTAARHKRFDDAERCYQQGIEECKAAGLALPHAALTTNMGLLQFMRGNLAEAETHSLKAIGLYAAAGMPELDFRDRHNIGAVRKHTGDLETAERMFREVLSRLGENSTNSSRWIAEQNLGEVEAARGLHESGLRRFRRAWRGHRRINRFEQVRAILWMGIAMCLSGRRKEGRKRIQAGEALYRSLRSHTPTWIDEWLDRAMSG
jgi:serine/threonine protein kinase/tetratricopeptide (TPR) repeat protein